jgi:branched-chain amino acid transport system ATP-binding protein
MSSLEVESIDVYYGDFQALWSLDLRVEAGGTLAIIGANGAGKSTLLGAIAGSRSVRSGSIRFDGRDVTAMPVHERVAQGITLVPEGRRLFPSLSVEENLTIGAFRRRSGPWTLTRVYEVLPIVEKLRRRHANELSGGEQQAVAIGRALMNNPTLLLLDEVSLGLAPVIVQSLYAVLPDVSAQGTTILLVEQDVGQAIAAADRVQCLLEGRVTLEGEAKDLDRDAVRAAYFGI